jgi:hypothetical protein
MLFEKHKSYTYINYFIALVWIVNGLYAKILNGVPRHQAIVEDILGIEWGPLLTKFIGVSEIFMAVWILSRWFYKLNAGLQIGIILLMNILEMTLCPELLLWGRWNFVFALLFCGIIYWNNFINNKHVR